MTPVIKFPNLVEADPLLLTETGVVQPQEEMSGVREEKKKTAYSNSSSPITVSVI